MIHLHTHSRYSFLEGLPAIDALVRTAAENGMRAVALTDHNLMVGSIEFYDACKKYGVQPILGMVVDASLPAGVLGLKTGFDQRIGGGRLVLLAEDMTGWGSLCRISSLLQSGNDGEAGKLLNFEHLGMLSKGLVCLTGGGSGWLADLISAGKERQSLECLRRLQEIFPDRTYAELDLSNPSAAAQSRKLRNIAGRLGLPLVAGHAVYYLQPEEAQLQRLLTAIRLNRPVVDVTEHEAAPNGSYFTTAEEVESWFREHIPDLDFSGLSAASLEIASRCQLDLPVGKRHYPEIVMDEGLSPSSALRKKAEEGAATLYGMRVKERVFRERLDHELKIISEFGYDSLFLIMADVIAHTREIGVPISSRGSAASSLVAHCLGITSPDPLRLNLYFERFLNPARATPPDIDTDLCSRRRDEVIHYVYERYGEDRVAMVCTIMRYRPRSALREAAKAHGLPGAEIKALADSLPHSWWRLYSEEGKESPFAELEERYRSPEHQKVFLDAKAILGFPRHLSVHPGGLVIAPVELNELVPLYAAPKGVMVTQFDLDSVERLGLVKIDLLGIRGLTVLGDTANALYNANPPAYSSMLGALESIPEDDMLTSEAIQHGRTIGCFQIESPGMRATLKEIQARTVDDIMVALALYRPGPLTGGLKEAFVRRHRKLEQPEQLHPALTPLLEDTYGVILYQEQVLRIANELAGFSLADSDLLRRAMSHFDPGKEMQKLKEKFVSGAWKLKRVPNAVAERVWELMAAFAGYGFPKAHAASYAVVGWRAAWCKVHHPDLFMAAVLANWGGYYGQRVYLTEARRMGLRVRPPHINYSGREFSVSYLQTDDGKTLPYLFMGLDQVRDLTRRSITAILRERPFQSLGDFLARVDPRQAEAENLVKAGGLDGIAPTSVLLEELKGGRRSKGQLPLFSMGHLDGSGSVEDWSLEKKVAVEEEILGVSVSAHPLELASNKIAAARAMNTLDAASSIGKKVRVAGMRQTWRRTRTVRGEYIYFMSLEDLEGMLNVVIPGDVYQKYRRAFSSPGPYFIEGEVGFDENLGEPFIRAVSCERVE